MAGKSKLTADAAERAALRDLSKSEQRGEADRARAILLTLEGRRAGEIAAFPAAALGAKNTLSAAHQNSENCAQMTSSDARATSSSITSPTAPSPILTLSTAPSITL